MRLGKAVAHKNDARQPRQELSPLEIVSRGLVGISVGFASVTLAAMTAIPGLLGASLPIAALYAQAVSRGAVAAIGTGTIAVVFWVYGYEARMGAPKNPSVWPDVVMLGFFLSGFWALIWGGMGLVDLALILPGAIRGL